LPYGHIASVADVLRDTPFKNASGKTEWQSLNAKNDGMQLVGKHMINSENS